MQGRISNFDKSKVQKIILIKLLGYRYVSRIHQFHTESTNGDNYSIIGSYISFSEAERQKDFLQKVMVLIIIFH